MFKEKLLLKLRKKAELFDLLTHRTNGTVPEAGVQLPPDKHLECLGTL